MKEMLNTLTKRSFAAGRVRNLVAVLAIALTAVLFTSVTTIGMGTLESLSLTMQMLKMSSGDAEVKNMTAEQFEALQKEPFVKKAGLRMSEGFLSNTKYHNVEFDVMDETEAELTFSAPTHGEYPKAENEVVTSDRALRALGAEPEAGAEVEIVFTAHGREYTKKMVVSGWFEAVNDQVSYMITGTKFRDANPDIFQYTYDRDKELAGVYYSDILAKSTWGLQEKLDDFSRSQGGNPDDMKAVNYLPASINRMRNPQMSGSILLAGGAFILLFIFCGYLLIYNVFDIAVMQDIRRYGLYRTIGMGKKQVKRLINRQAVWLCCMGTPIGLVLGYFIGKSTLPVIMSMVSTEYSNVSADVSPSLVLFLTAAVLTVFTVFLSTRKPVRVAANIPPIEAFHYVESTVGRHTAKHSAGQTKLPQMAFANLGRNKRRTGFIIISLTLCVVLLNCVGTIAASVDISKQVNQMIRTDFAVLHADTMNNMKGFTTRDMAVSDRTIADIAAQPGVRDGTSVYKNTLEDINVTYDFGMEWKYTEGDYKNGLTRAFNKDLFSFILGEDGSPMCNVYGMEEASIARMTIKEGETDPHTVYEKMCAGEGVLLGVPGRMGSMEYDSDFEFLDVGDTITVRKNGEPVRELPVLAKAVLNGDDEEIGYTVNGANEVGGDGLYLYLPSGVYKELYDAPAVYKYAFNVEEEHRSSMTSFLDDYRKNKDMSINYMSAESARASAEGTKKMIYFVGGIVGMIFGLAGVLNLTNMLITSIITRRHEFATMQSIGMTGRQLTKMMTFEGIYYALGAVLAGTALSVLLGLTLVRSLCSGLWQFTFHLTVMPACITSAVLLIFALVIPVLALRMFHKGSIVEQLRVAE